MGFVVLNSIKHLVCIGSFFVSSKGIFSITDGDEEEWEAFHSCKLQTYRLGDQNSHKNFRERNSFLPGNLVFSIIVDSSIHGQIKKAPLKPFFCLFFLYLSLSTDPNKYILFKKYNIIPIACVVVYF